MSNSKLKLQKFHYDFLLSDSEFTFFFNKKLFLNLKKKQNFSLMSQNKLSEMYFFFFDKIFKKIIITKVFSVTNDLIYLNYSLNFNKFFDLFDFFFILNIKDVKSIEQIYQYSKILKNSKILLFLSLVKKKNEYRHTIRTLENHLLITDFFFKKELLFKISNKFIKTSSYKCTNFFIN